MGLNEKLETLPIRPGVYMFKDAEGHVLYVGKARVLRDRVRSYFQAARPIDPQRGDMVSQISDLDLVVTDTEMEALGETGRAHAGTQARWPSPEAGLLLQI